MLYSTHEGTRHLDLLLVSCSVFMVITCYSTMLNFGVLLLVEFAHGTR